MSAQGIATIEERAHRSAIRLIETKGDVNGFPWREQVVEAGCEIILTRLDNQARLLSHPNMTRYSATTHERGLDGEDRSHPASCCCAECQDDRRFNA
jgi:hypothetical protein